MPTFKPVATLTRCEKWFTSVYPAQNPKPEYFMSVDLATVKRVARLARIAVNEEDANRMTGELNAILGFVQQLDEVDVSGIEPLTSVIPMALRRREDAITDGAKAEDVVANAPASEENFFVVPKVIE
jgi:aspartyl-tRNA(Asn)/glutamyl-tRNA(Gln) amidotransferase subunit C